jgi:hypothetical protein
MPFRRPLAESAGMMCRRLCLVNRHVTCRTRRRSRIVRSAQSSARRPNTAREQKVPMQASVRLRK